MSLWAVYVVFLSALLSRATAQAPGDREVLCDRVNAVIPPAYPANVKILMDSYNYRNLLTILMPFSSVWQQVDNDNTTSGDGVSPVTWFQSTAISCRQTMSVCGFSFGKQDNWLITQHISRVVNGIRLPQVSVLVQFELKGCNVNECQRTFKLNAWETSTVNRAEARNTANYRHVNWVPFDEDSGLNKTMEINFRTDEDGFYLAVQDEGVSDRVIHPETLAPIIDRQSPLVEVTTTCVTGTSPENKVTAKLTCAQGGVWNAVTNSGCRCNSGLVETGDGLSCIEGCPASQYLSNQDECRKCPANSMSEGSGLSVCPCMMGYYRRPDETDLPCTQPPGPPTDVQVMSVAPTVVSLRWGPPKFTGGRNDTSYTLWWYRPQGDNKIVAISTNTTFQIITGLDPNECYNFLVSAKNGVSRLDGTIENVLAPLLNWSCSGMVTSKDPTTGLLGGVIFLATVLLFMLGLIGILLAGFYIYVNISKSPPSSIHEEMDAEDSHDVITIQEIQQESDDDTSTSYVESSYDESSVVDDDSSENGCL